MKTLGKTLVLLLLSFFLIQLPVFAADKGNFSTTPKTNNGKKWRIGYYETGPYNNYHKTFKATIDNLMTLGWIEKTALPSQYDPQDTNGLYLWLTSNAKSSYIELVADAFYTSKWDNDLRPKVRKEIIDRLNKKKDIDLMLVMGTKAGQDLANNEHSTPTEIGSTTDALAAGIIKNLKDSGYDHIHAQIEPMRHEQQVRLFHDIIRFKRLGVAYRNTPVGRSTAAIDSVEKVAKERGFEVVACNLDSMIPGTEEDEKKEEKAVKCYEFLAPKSDAVYITRYAGGVTLPNLANIMAPLYKSKVPTFSQAGSEEVEYGALFSISEAQFRYVGQFHAEAIARIFNGAKPRSLPQEFQSPPKISINLAVAKIIGYDPPVDILGVADEIYEKIKNIQADK